MKSCILFVVIFFRVTNAQFEGDECIMRHDQAEGVCTRDRDCSTLLALLRTGEKATTCAFIGGTHFVCCPTKAEQQLISTKADQQPVSKASPKPSEPRISAKKCADYKKLVLTSFEGDDLSLDRKTRTALKETCVKPAGLVVGGTKTRNGEFPHMAFIGSGYRKANFSFFCGGSLISDRFVLTAAHCFINTKTKSPFARLGDQNIKSRSDGLIEVDIPIIHFIKHEKFSRSTKQNDIALAKLSYTVKFTKFIRPACLYQESRVSKQEAIATGWGSTEYAGNFGSDELLKVSLDLINIKLCADAFDDVVINDNQICAGHLEGGKDTCQGDSGGPLQVKSNGSECIHEIIGITSIGIGCGLKNSKSVYTRVSAYLDWIESKAFLGER